MVAMDVIIYLIVFYIGACLGRYVLILTKKKEEENSSHLHCDRCGKKGDWKQNIPILGYLIVKEKCACGKHINLFKEFFTEFAFGSIFFLLCTIFPIGIEEAKSYEIVICVFSFIYIGILMVIAAIDKKEHSVKKGALLIGFIMESIYMLYCYIMKDISLYVNLAYLLLLFILLMIDTILLRKKGKSNYTIQILMLAMYMILFTQEKIFLITVIFTLLICAVYLLIKKLMKKRMKYKKYKKEEVGLPIGFYLCITNIICFIFINLIGWKI